VLARLTIMFCALCRGQGMFGLVHVWIAAELALVMALLMAWMPPGGIVMCQTALIRADPVAESPPDDFGQEAEATLGFGGSAPDGGERARDRGAGRDVLPVFGWVVVEGEQTGRSLAGHSTAGAHFTP
jgi:hypothetical protein